MRIEEKLFVLNFEKIRLCLYIYIYMYVCMYCRNNSSNMQVLCIAYMSQLCEKNKIMKGYMKWKKNGEERRPRERVN